MYYLNDIFASAGFNNVSGNVQAVVIGLANLPATPHWVMNALIVQIFPILARTTKAIPFGVFAALTAVQFFVVWLVYPETTGYTLEDMQHHLGHWDAGADPRTYKVSSTGRFDVPCKRARSDYA